MGQSAIGGLPFNSFIGNVALATENANFSGRFKSAKVLKTIMMDVIYYTSLSERVYSYQTSVKVLFQ